MKLEQHQGSDRTIDVIYFLLGILLIAMIGLSTYRIVSLTTQF